MNGTLGAHLLVVDDNEVNREMLALHLRMRHYSVTLSDSGTNALEKLHLPRTPGIVHRDFEYDLVLLDVMMPEVSGTEVLQIIRQHYTRAELPVIMVTARDASEDVVQAMEHGANDYITKPIDFPVLFARLEAALQLQKLSRQKDEFMAIASHDLKNPLAIVRGFVKMVRALTPEGSPMTADCVDMLNRVFRQTTSMQHIINDFLDFHAMQEGHLLLHRHDMEMCSTIQQSIDALSMYAAEKQITLLEPECGDVMVHADEARLEQVLQNFIGNAIKFGFPGGIVRIRATVSSPMVRIEVIDDGPGIPEGEHERLFVKYARLSNRPTGGEKSSGLGLVICKQIIELHGGEVGAFNNSSARGSTFWFDLPILKPRSGPV